MDLNSKNWFSGGPRQPLLIGAGVVALLVGGYLIGRSDRDGAPANGSAPFGMAAATGQGGARPMPAGFNAGPGPVPLDPLSATHCNAFAPGGWRVTDQNPDGTVMTAQSPDGRMTASWSGIGVGSMQVQGLTPGVPALPDAPAFALYLAGVLAGEPAQQTGAIETLGDYRVVHFTTATHRGYALSYQAPNPSDANGYIAISRIAIGDLNDQRSLGAAGSVAASMRCNVALHPPSGGYAQVEARTSSHGAGQGADGDSTMAGTYNAQLGTGWVHDDTGRNYNVDVTADWVENGPDGPGYYKRNGNDVTKLTPGLQ